MVFTPSPLGKKNNFRYIIFAGIICVIIGSLMVSIPGLMQRHRYESANTTYHICVEFNEIADIAEVEHMHVSEVLKIFKFAGLTAVALFQRSYDPETNLSSKLTSSPHVYDEQAAALIKKNNLWLMIRPPNPWYMDTDALRYKFIREDFHPQADIFLTAGNEAYGFPDKLAVCADMLGLHSVQLAWLEFGGQKGSNLLARAYPSKALRTYSVEKKLLDVIENRSQLIDRLVRAVRERGVRLLYIHLLPEQDINGNTAFIKSMVARLKKYGFSPGQHTAVWPQSLKEKKAIRQILGLMAAWIFPIFGLYAGICCLELIRGKWAWVYAFFAANGITLIGGLVIGSIVSIPAYMSGLYLFRGIKISLMIPLFCAFVWLFNLKDMARLWEKPVIWKEAVCIIGMAGMIFLLLVRSGNYNVLTNLGGIENQARLFLEQIFSVRPRTKEFIVGQPLMLAAWWGWHQSMRSSKPLINSYLLNGMLCIGFIGQASIINTFMHAHTPLSISILRSFHGIWLGMGAGLLLISIIKGTARMRKHGY
ncbi:MAG: DUF5693 family protein [bacterium]